MTTQDPVQAVAEGGPFPLAPCPHCGSSFSQPGPVLKLAYAIGHLEPRFASLGVEKEFQQLAAALGTERNVSYDSLEEIVGSESGSYLLDHLCWIFRVHGSDVFFVQPWDRDEKFRLLAMSSAGNNDERFDVIVGAAAFSLPTPSCVSSGLPAVYPAQVFSFTFEDFIANVPRPTDGGSDVFPSIVRSVLQHSLNRVQNFDTMDADRAINYLTLRYPDIYATADSLAGARWELERIETSIVQSREARQIVTARYVFGSDVGSRRRTFECRVDVTDVFPFLASSLREVFV
jgi:hypothetical protein